MQLDDENDCVTLTDVQTSSEVIKTQDPRRVLHPFDDITDVTERRVVQYNSVVKRSGDKYEFVVVYGDVVRSSQSSVSDVTSYDSAVFADYTDSTVVGQDPVTDEVLAADQLDAVPRQLDDRLQRYLTHTLTSVATYNSITIAFSLDQSLHVTSRLKLRVTERPHGLPLTTGHFLIDPSSPSRCTQVLPVPSSDI